MKNRKRKKRKTEHQRDILRIPSIPESGELNRNKLGRTTIMSAKYRIDDATRELFSSSRIDLDRLADMVMEKPKIKKSRCRSRPISMP
jgi:hypothetical protein